MNSLRYFSSKKLAMETNDRFKDFVFKEVFSHFERQWDTELKRRFLGSLNTDINSRLFILANILAPLLGKLGNLRLRRSSAKEITVLYYIDPMAYIKILSSLSDNVNLFINNPLRCSPLQLYWKSSVFFSPVVLAARRLNYGIVNNDGEQFFKGLDQLRRILSRNTPSVIVVNDPIFPINRALIMIARELGVPTVEIQHATYPLSSQLIGSGADYIFVWGTKFKQMHLNQKFKKNNEVKILGFPYQVIDIPIDPNKEKLSVCYLAQGFQDALIDNVLRLNRFCDQNNMEFMCRLHPSSPPISLKKILPGVKFVPKDQKLIDTIRWGDIFISFNSTSLIESALYGKHSIQLRNIPELTEDFEELGICPKSFENVEDVENYLKEFKTVKPSEMKQFYKKVNPDYIELPLPDPGTRFHELIQEVVAESVSGGF
jgi:hypothetical protein